MRQALLSIPAPKGRSMSLRRARARSLNTAWLSVASSVAALVVPAAYGVDGSVEWVALCLVAIFTALGAGQQTNF